MKPTFSGHVLSSNPTAEASGHMGEVEWTT